MDYSWAKPGAKCVRVTDAHPLSRSVKEFGIKMVKGGVYTIRLVRVDRYTGRLLLVFGELPDPGGNLGWGIEAFRPLITRTQEQDVALFRHLLDGLPVGERVS